MAGIFDLSARLGPVAISPHFFLETLAYLAGFAMYERDRRLGDLLRPADRSSIVVAVIAGAALGSKILAWLEDPGVWLTGDWAAILGGKTIVGGLLGGTIAVEWVKRRMGITRRTGDLFAIPLAVGIAIGRIGCFLAGLNDRTYGVATTLPWGVDFGDGVSRHPTQLYETAFLLLLAWILARLRKAAHREGDLYRAFLLAYLVWRLAIDFLKPDPAFAGLSAIQWASLAAIAWYAREGFALLFSRGEAEAHG